MRKPAFIVTIITLFLILPHLTFAEPNMLPGSWEISATIDMPGMAFSMPATKHTQCISEEDIVPQMQQENDKCQTLENRLDGDTVTWKITCESEGGTMTSHGKIVYKGNSFAGTVITTGSQIPSDMTQKLSGNRIGACQ